MQNMYAPDKWANIRCSKRTKTHSSSTITKLNLAGQKTTEEIRCFDRKRKCCSKCYYKS